MEQGIAAAAMTTPLSSQSPTWRRVNDLADLVEIFDPAVQVCVWQRDRDATISDYLTGLERTGTLQLIETLSAEGRPQLTRLPAGLEPVPGRAALIDDVSLLREIVCELLGCPAVGLRAARVGHAMCPRWHIDRVGIRLICTYQGPGTQWLDGEGIDRCEPRFTRMQDDGFIQAAPGEVVLLKGALWQGNERLGAGARTLVTLDPLWHA